MAWTNILDAIYPVGSIYFSTVGASPANFIGGTWTQILNKVIRTGDSFETGGADSEVIDFNHNHAMTLAKATGPWDFTTGLSGIGYHDGDAAIVDGAVLTSNSKCADQFQNVCGPAEVYGGNNGVALGEKTISHLPAYQSVFCWYRTA